MRPQVQNHIKLIGQAIHGNYRGIFQQVQLFIPSTQLRELIILLTTSRILPLRPLVQLPTSMRLVTHLLVQLLSSLKLPVHPMAGLSTSTMLPEYRSVPCLTDTSTTSHSAFKTAAIQCKLGESIELGKQSMLQRHYQV